jgi:hypothetical protein
MIQNYSRRMNIPRITVVSLNISQERPPEAKFVGYGIGPIAGKGGERKYPPLGRR